ncbi:MAG: hypothetical protein IH898_09475 [Planctomycetes bacterium]|nr:hypothetical protein [Planctomycetota bacterium]
MRMLDNEHDNASRDIALYLTPKEARQLRNKLDWLIKHPGEHFHLNDEELSREISVSLYEDELLQSPDRIGTQPLSILLAKTGLPWGVLAHSRHNDP